MTSKRLFTALVAIAAVALLLVPAGFAQNGQNGSATGKTHRIYDPATETTVTGTIESIHKVRSWRNKAWAGTHLTLKTESGDTYDIHLGPASYLEQQDFSFAKGEQVEITGSKVMYKGKDAIIAREVKKDGKTLTLRDAQGFPAWAGQRRGAMN